MGTARFGQLVPWQCLDANRPESPMADLSPERRLITRRLRPMGIAPGLWGESR